MLLAMVLAFLMTPKFEPCPHHKPIDMSQKCTILYRSEGGMTVVMGWNMVGTDEAIRNFDGYAAYLREHGYGRFVWDEKRRGEK